MKSPEKPLSEDDVRKPTSELPEWLPPVVAPVARRLVARGSTGGLAHRLATDSRMKSVWRELAKSEQPFAGALGLFFVHAFMYAHLRVRVETFSELNKLRNGFEYHAAQLRASANWLDGADYGGWWDAEFYADTEFMASSSSSVEEMAEYCDAAAAAISRVLATGHLFVVPRSQGDARVRGYVRALADKARLMFRGKVHYGSLATVTNVALVPKVPVTPKHVINWCSTNKDA